MIQNDNLSNIINLQKEVSKKQYLDAYYEKFFSLLNSITSNYVFLWKHREIILSRLEDKLSKHRDPTLETKERISLFKFYYTKIQEKTNTPNIIFSRTELCEFYPENFTNLKTLKKKNFMFYISAFYAKDFILNFLFVLKLLEIKALIVLPYFHVAKILNQCNFLQKQFLF